MYDVYIGRLGCWLRTASSSDCDLVSNHVDGTMSASATDSTVVSLTDNEGPAASPAAAAAVDVCQRNDSTVNFTAEPQTPADEPIADQNRKKKMGECTALPRYDTIRYEMLF